MRLMDSVTDSALRLTLGVFAYMIPYMSHEDKKYPTPLQKRVMWTALCLLCLAFIVALAIACAVAALKGGKKC